METLYFLGIDVSKKTLDAALTIDGKQFHQAQFENQACAIDSYFKSLKKQLSSFSNLVVCLEHTGIYSNILLAVLMRYQVQVCVESALQIKRSQGMTRGKNDQVDAQRIALYAFKNKDCLTFWRPQRECIQRLKALLVTRERLVQMKVQLEVPIAESNDFVDPKILKKISKCCSSSIRSLKQDINRIESEIDNLIKEDTQLDSQYSLVTSVPGIGKITALNIIVSTAEFSRITNPRKFACYAGVAPFEHRSGTSIRGKTRVSRMANMTLKRLLHLAAMSAITCCDELRDYYQRKVKSGKNKMSVINAVRNKLISRVFACITNNRAYQKNYQNDLA
jgi:transposase